MNSWTARSRPTRACAALSVRGAILSVLVFAFLVESAVVVLVAVLPPVGEAAGAVDTTYADAGYAAVGDGRTRFGHQLAAGPDFETVISTQVRVPSPRGIPCPAFPERRR